jgi:hypothetical protein
MTTTHEWHNIYITDKSGRKMWNTTASPMSTISEIRNLKQHLTAAAKHPEQYPSLDLATAVIMLDGEPYGEPLTMTDDEFLKELGA